MDFNSGGKSNKNHQKPNKVKRDKSRILLLQGTLILALGVVLWRVFDIQDIYGAKLKKSELGYIDVTKPILAKRGAILDAQGDKMAFDITGYYFDIKTDIHMKAYASSVANAIAPILGTSVATMTSTLEQNAPWVQWPVTISASQKTQLIQVFNKHAWDTSLRSTQWSNYITFTPTAKRIYPFQNVAANVLGYVASNGTAVGGVEQEYNSYLFGSNGTVQYEQDPDGFPMPNTVHTAKPARQGDNVQLTINGTIQGFVENEMNQLVNTYHPDHAAIIVTNPQTGAILAMASRPTFNPNTYWSASTNALSQNWAFSSFEPGSTFKPYIFAAALNSNSISPNTTYPSGQYVVDGQTIHDWNGVGWGTMTYQEALEKSSNTGFARIALATGWPTIDKYLRLFGFTQPTGIDLPGENSSILFPKSEQNPIELATTGFGQGISVTPIQQMMAMGVIANGGRLMHPYVVSKITSPSGKVIQAFHPTVVRQGFVSKSVLNYVKHTMVLDVSGAQGIDTVGQIPGYSVAGKTGTAQIVNPKTGQYYSNRFIVSFMGFAPAANPKVEVYVTVDYPKAPLANTWGSTIAGPYARNILKDCLEYYHIAPNGMIQSVSQATPTTGTVQYVDTPDIIGLTVKAAQTKLQSVGLTPFIDGQGNVVKNQWPKPGIQVVKGTQLYGVLNSGTNHEVMLPNLTGLSLREATNLLAALSLNIKPSGLGFVVRQSTPANSMVKVGSVVSVSLQP